MDVFDGLPDSIIIDILNKVGDVRTLLRCCSLSKRFNSLIPQSDSLLLQLHHPDSDSPVATSIFRSFFDNFLSFFSKPAKPAPVPTLSPNIPSQILSRFDRIRDLNVELPGGDVKLEKGSVVKWKAECGKSLKSCVVFAFRSAATESSSVAIDGESDAEFVTGIKTRVMWTISALIAASSRHYLMKEVVKEHEEMESLVIRDVQRQGTVTMKSKGLKEFRNTEVARGGNEEERVVKNKRSVIPSVKMTMRHAPSLNLNNGIYLKSATLVIVRTIGEDSDICGDDAELAMEAFAGDCMYGEAVVALLKCKKDALQMNSF